MAKIYNSDCTKGLAKNAGIQQSVDKVPNELAEKIVPTFETNPEMLRRINILISAGNAATGNVTAYTTPTDRDFFLCSANLTSTSTAASDNTLVSLKVVPKGGASTTILEIPKQTLTAHQDTITLGFNPPIILERNSTILIVGSFTAGTTTKTANLHGYIVDSAA